jgi:hypothetical protein
MDHHHLLLSNSNLPQQLQERDLQDPIHLLPRPLIFHQLVLVTMYVFLISAMVAGVHPLLLIAPK